MEIKLSNTDFRECEEENPKTDMPKNEFNPHIGCWFTIILL